MPSRTNGLRSTRWAPAVVALAMLAVISACSHDPRVGGETNSHTIFGDRKPVNPTSDTDTKAVELGVRFRSTAPGWITSVRFYKTEGNTGTHTGSLWTKSGKQLATGT